MSDPVTTARAARESLSRGLSALQSDPNIPPQLLDLAAPIAQAMGALHAIERSNGTQLVPHAEVALTHTRAALGQLQAQPPSHQAITQAMEAVASSLAGVHALNRMVPANPAAAQPQAAFAPTAVQPAAPFPLNQPARAAAPAPFPAPAVRPPQADPFAAPRAAPAPVAAAVAGGGAASAPAAGHSSMNPPSPPSAADLPVMNADLGTQSPTNFYKGLSGNDIIEAGGLFVSTYMIPKIGTNIRLKISLPGGYEFEANAVVQWSREQSDDGAAPPGFGARFTQITPEARQLVYRYTRNREPLFHDDF